MGNAVPVPQEGEQYLTIRPEPAKNRLAYDTSFPKTLEGHISKDKYDEVMAYLEKDLNQGGGGGLAMRAVLLRYTSGRRG